MIARAELAPGEPIQDLHLETAVWPADLLPLAAILNVSDAVGRVPRRTVLEGEPLLGTALLPRRPAGSSDEGERQVTVKTGNEYASTSRVVDPSAELNLLGSTVAAEHPVQIVRGGELSIRNF